MDSKVMFKLSYGLYVLTASEEDRDNGCIINTALQVTGNPNRISITVNKMNHTHDMIKRTGCFNVSMLTEQVSFDVIKNFGFQSGKTVNKFEDYEGYLRADNGIIYLTKFCNGFISAKVFKEIDLGTHTMFISDVTDGKIISDIPSVTYDFYQKNIKPAPAKTEKKGWICKICGYVHESEELPEDFICPICKHGAADFEKL